MKQTEIPFLELQVIDPHATHTFKVLWLEVETPTGDFVVTPDHYPLISLLKHQSKLSYQTTENTNGALEIVGGVISIESNRVLVLLDESSRKQ